jgi:hypothetical protein
MDLMRDNLLLENYENYVSNLLIFSDEMKKSKYLIIDENYFNYLISNIYGNHLLILFSLSFFTTLFYCSSKRKNKYRYYLISNNDNLETIDGKLVDDKV